MHPDFATIAHALVARFRRQRPLRGGSLLVTILGDSIMPRGGSIALSSLIRLAAAFGLNERLVRTATTRLAHDGWVESQRCGRLSEYRLSPNGRDRLAEGTQRIYFEPAARWTGHWTLVVLPGMRAGDRQRVRKELVWHGFGEISANLFAHPDAHAEHLVPHTFADSLPREVLVFDANLTDRLAPDILVKLGWDLAELAKRYQRFVRRFERALMALSARPPPVIEPESAFTVRTLLVHEYRKLHLRDPLLPQSLLPQGWPGTRARELCRDIYRRLVVPSEHYLSTAASCMNAPLPPADRTLLQRFSPAATPRALPPRARTFV